MHPIKKNIIILNNNVNTNINTNNNTYISSNNHCNNTDDTNALEIIEIKIIPNDENIPIDVNIIISKNENKKITCFNPYKNVKSPYNYAEKNKVYLLEICNTV
jgi:hypothetical protein